MPWPVLRGAGFCPARHWPEQTRCAWAGRQCDLRDLRFTGSVWVSDTGPGGVAGGVSIGLAHCFGFATALSVTERCVENGTQLQLQTMPAEHRIGKCGISLGHLEGVAGFKQKYNTRVALH